MPQGRRRGASLKLVKRQFAGAVESQYDQKGATERETGLEQSFGRLHFLAGMAELADAADLKSFSAMSNLSLNNCKQARLTYMPFLM